MKLSCAFPTTMSSAEDVRIAEEIGYERAWLYDTPQQSPDVWAMLALAAERTTRIGLGPGVLVPHLRHPMTNAAATAMLAEMAPGRVAVSFGTGFTGRRAMGYRALTWVYMTAYMDAFCGLLRGEVIEWEGVSMQMLHPDGSGAARPVDVPILVGAIGPKGRAIAERFDGVFAASTTNGLHPGAFPWVAYLYYGTVVDQAEELSSERVRLAAGPATSLAYHVTYELDSLDAARRLPGGDVWADSISQHEQHLRHLEVHRGHLIHMNDADNAAWDSTAGAFAPAASVTGTASEVSKRLEEFEAAGVTEAVYGPAGPDPRRELQAMYDAFNG